MNEDRQLPAYVIRISYDIIAEETPGHDNLRRLLEMGERGLGVRGRRFGMALFAVPDGLLEMLDALLDVRIGRRRLSGLGVLQARLGMGHEIGGLALGAGGDGFARMRLGLSQVVFLLSGHGPDQGFDRIGLRHVQDGVEGIGLGQNRARRKKKRNGCAEEDSRNLADHFLLPLLA